MVLKGLLVGCRGKGFVWGLGGGRQIERVGNRF